MIRKASMNYLNAEFIRFIFVGGLTTGATYILYWSLVQVLDFRVSYSIAYISGIFLSYYLNSRIVFKSEMRLQKFIQYPLVYVVQYTISIVLLSLLVDFLGLSEAIAPVLVIFCSIPLTFSLSRWIIRPRVDTSVSQ